MDLSKHPINFSTFYFTLLWEIFTNSLFIIPNFKYASQSSKSTFVNFVYYIMEYISSNLILSKTVLQY
jgi:hypothetical protein